VSVALEARSLDAVQLWPGGLGGGRLEALLARGPAAIEPAAAGGEGKPVAQPARSLLAGSLETDFKLRIKAGELTAGSQMLRDVDGELALDGGNLTLPMLKFTTADGLVIERDGQVAGGGCVVRCDPDLRAVVGRVGRRRRRGRAS
jgi:hypothetical protein